jgi:hypothetical protein
VVVIDLVASFPEAEFLSSLAEGSAGEFLLKAELDMGAFVEAEALAESDNYMGDGVLRLACSGEVVRSWCLMVSRRYFSLSSKEGPAWSPGKD